MTQIFFQNEGVTKLEDFKEFTTTTTTTTTITTTTTTTTTNCN